MRRLQDGFLLIEILISFVLITCFILIYMQYQGKSLSVQGHAITTMDVVNRLEELLDDFLTDRRSLNVSDRKFTLSSSLEHVTRPIIQASPPNFTIGTVAHMKVIMLYMSWTDQCGPCQCCLPLIFKEQGYETY